MKKKRFFKKSVLFTLVILLMLSIFCITVHAAPDGGEGDGSDTFVVDDGSGDAGDPGEVGDIDTGDGAGDDNPGNVPDDPAPDDPADIADTATEVPEPTEDYLNGTVDAQSSYTEPEHLDELDTVDSEDVVLATAVTVPTAQVSDASLLSGIIMWLCVAVGIAVVVGVMVSKRTRRRGV